MASSKKDFEDKSGTTKTSTTGIFKDEQKVSSEILPQEVGTLLKDIFRKNTDLGDKSALEVTAVNVSIKDGNPEWKFDYTTRNVRRYDKPSPGSYGRYKFLEALNKTKNEFKMDMEVKDRSHIVIRDNHVKFLECLKNNLPKIYEEFIKNMPSQRDALLKEQAVMTDRCQALIDRLPSYLDSLKQTPRKEM